MGCELGARTKVTLSFDFKEGKRCRRARFLDVFMFQFEISVPMYDIYFHVPARKRLVEGVHIAKNDAPLLLFRKII